MLFRMDNFKVDLNDFSSYGLTHKNELGNSFDFNYWLLTNPIILEPVDKIPSFYMVNKYGEVYSDTQYFLVPYIRFMIPDPFIDYSNNTVAYSGGEAYRTDYRQNPFHPYWIGGLNYTGMSTQNGFINPNKNAYQNMKNLMDIYLLPSSSGSTVKPLCMHGIRNESTKIMKLAGIGEDLVSNEGSLKNGMFIPADSKYLQASIDGNPVSAVDNHFLNIYSFMTQSQRDTSYSYFLGLSGVSNDPNKPYILPPLFTDLFSHVAYYSSDVITGANYAFNNGVAQPSCISVLTFGVRVAN